MSYCIFFRVCLVPLFQGAANLAVWTSTTLAGASVQVLFQFHHRFLIITDFARPVNLHLFLLYQLNQETVMGQ